MKKIVFPTPNNKAFRNGFICLQAFEPDFNVDNMWQMSQSGDSTGNSWVNKVKFVNNKEYQPIFDAKSSEDYLKNALQNRDLEQQSSKIGELGFVAYLPTPLNISDATSIEWTPSKSAIIEGKYSRFNNAKAGPGMIDNIIGVADSISEDYVSKAIAQTGWSKDKVLRYARLGHLQDVIDNVRGRSNAVFESLVNHEFGKVMTSSKDAFAGFSADMDLMTALNEQNARDGRRQVVFDPGYWQQFIGVQPRGVTFSWELIPENHSEAVDLLALVNRFKEFSLPQAVSYTELISPAIWRIRFHNDFLQSQLLYSDLVLVSVNMTYMEQGEIHVTGTPKKVSLTLTFQEVKAPINNIYRDGQRSAGSANSDYANKVQNGFSSSKVLDSLSAIQQGKLGGAGGGGGLLGGLLGNSGLGKLGGIIDKVPGLSTGLGGIISAGSQVLGQVQGALGEAVSGIQTAITNIANGAITGVTGTLGDVISGPIGSVFGDKYGKLAEDMFDNLGSAVGNAISETIQTGNIKALPDALKSAALGSLTGAASQAISEITGDALEYAGSIVNEALSPITDWVNETVGDVGGTLTDWIKEATEGVIGAITPEQTARSEASKDAQKELETVDKETERAKELAKQAEQAKKLAETMKANPNQDPAEVAKAEQKAQDLAKQAQQAAKNAEDAQKRASEAIEKAKAENAKIEAQQKAKTDWETKENQYKTQCTSTGGTWTAGKFDPAKGANSGFGSCRV